MSFNNEENSEKDYLFGIWYNQTSKKFDIYNVVQKRSFPIREWLKVNGLSVISRKAEVVVGKNINFNGLRVIGGQLSIGDNFHSGSNVKIMLGSHDFGHGSAIPYGLEETRKEVHIADNV